MFLKNLDVPILAATETAKKHGVATDRCEVLQNGSTLVLRLSETLVARVVVDIDGPRKGTAWFARENAIAQQLTLRGAPVIPLHPDLPAGPHEHLGYTLNFWKYVTSIGAEPEPALIGETLFQCHEALRSFPYSLPALAIITESQGVLQTLQKDRLFEQSVISLLERHLNESLKTLASFPQQALHGDAHMGNLMNTTEGLLWTDWEDAFSGPVEWDIASIIWNAQILDEDHTTVQAILNAYRQAGGDINPTALHYSLIARAAVMTAWYPILYPNPSGERLQKLQRRIDWLQNVPLEA